ncbi:toxin co-regulated pilus biosynthesis Q family protein (plasmid) [Comamonas aquatica]|nr:toxin co-regulated pilus biosynthesis Q family protein [Comamonas aquatica]
MPSISAQYKLKLGLSEAAVHYVGGGRDGNFIELPVNHITKRSYAAVAKGDDYEWIANKEHSEQAVVFKNGEAKVTVTSAKSFSKLASKLLKATSIEVVAYNQPDYEPGLAQRRMDAIVNSLTAFGIERSKIKKSISLTGASEVSGGVVGARIGYVIGSEVKPLQLAQTNITKRESTNQKTENNVQSTDNAKPGSNKQLFRIEPSDKSILDVIQRWAIEANWDVIAIDFPHIPLEQPEATQIAYGSYLDAIEKMEQGLAAKGYNSVRSRAYTNNVLEIGALNEPRK